MILIAHIRSLSTLDGAVARARTLELYIVFCFFSSAAGT
jgi:hypothetical protein